MNKASIEFKPIENEMKSEDVRTVSIEEVKNSVKSGTSNIIESPSGTS